MRDQWLAMEHYRLHSVEEWPDGPKKEAALAGIRSKLDSLSGDALASHIHCAICLDRSERLLQFPPTRLSPAPFHAAA
jgi:hypothetical protein